MEEDYNGKKKSLDNAPKIRFYRREALPVTFKPLSERMEQLENAIARGIKKPSDLARELNVGMTAIYKYLNKRNGNGKRSGKKRDNSIKTSIDCKSEDISPDPQVNRVIYGGEYLLHHTNLVALFKRNKYQINPIAKSLKDDYVLSPLTARRAVVYGLERIELDEKAKKKLEEQMKKYEISSTRDLRLREVRD